MAFLSVKSVEEVESLVDSFNLNPDIEEIDIVDSVNLTLAEDVYASISLPPYNRSAVDGYCVKWEDVSGASEALPIFLKITEDVQMGQAPLNALETDCCMAVATGSMLPPEATSVVMVEHSERISEDEVAIYNSVASYENILKEGEDVKKGDLLMKKDQQITSFNINLLAALGINKIKVYKKIVVGILSTGDELIEYNTDNELNFGKIFNSNGPGLIAAVKSTGAIPRYYGIIEDEFSILKEALDKAVKECDIVILTGGTSVGVKDFVTAAIESLGKPGVLVHGIAIKPGKPTIIGKVDDVPIFGLSGNPVSAMICFDLFVNRLLTKVKPETIVCAVSRNIPSSGGRQDYIPVTLTKVQDKIIASPIFAKSNSIGSLTKMDGLLVIPKDSEGLEEGNHGKVILYKGKGWEDDLLK
ncbi:molybdopterin molybdenumtransferase MoeA [Alkalicella caledoniensis]|uniref:Molybdopterin molybdenumtransferase n=1 Tax=Alkalicella caledoniensis TaxID=2731377 RepID=A0A7G9W959_ALKCA|nr:gephyrin-like molybdotransferase Glp [Alkalicella caledoniensis]QNO15221.1 molybdopterin molybdenumtransferase MoeA [Alkalicella caledoniensis]